MPQIARRNMVYLVVIFISPLYFLLRKKYAAFLVNAIIYGIALLFVLSILGAFIAPFFWLLAFVHASYYLRKEVMNEFIQKHAETIATEMAKKVMLAGAVPAPVSAPAMAPVSLLCRACGKGVTPGNAFCPACGVSVGASVSTPDSLEVQGTSASSSWLGQRSMAISVIFLVFAVLASSMYWLSRRSSVTAVTTPSVKRESVTRPAPYVPVATPIRKAVPPREQLQLEQQTVRWGADGIPVAVGPRPADTDSCYSGIWAENKENNLRWNFLIIDGQLRVTRTDGFVSGLFNYEAGVWRGTLQWGNGSISNDVVLYQPSDSCTTIRTNQQWWFMR